VVCNVRSYLGLSHFVHVGFSEAAFGANLNDPLQSLLTAGAVLIDDRLYTDTHTHTVSILHFMNRLHTDSETDTDMQIQIHSSSYYLKDKKYIKETTRTIHLHENIQSGEERWRILVVKGWSVD